jgi:peptidoglycan/LPS O-acetylase OafA/YrhL
MERPPETRPTPGTADRFHELDAVRSAAMLLGLFFHGAVSFIETPTPWAVRDRSTHWIADLFVWVCHTFRMPVFFLMSGFFARLLHARLGTAAFLRQRARRILLPFAAALVPTMAAVYGLWRWGWSKTPPPAAGAYPGLEAPSLELSELTPSPAHLWFLYYLSLLLAALVPALALGGKLRDSRLWARLDAVYGAAVRSWTLPFVAALPTAATLHFMHMLEADTPVSFVPQPRILAYYAVFFAFGWWLQRSPSLIAVFPRRLAANAAFAALALPALLPLLDRAGREGRLSPESLRTGALYLSAFFGWSMLLLFIGVFVRWLSDPSPRVRWLADASYWCYLVHLPVVVSLQVLLADRAWPGPLKYALLMAATLAVCLGSYGAFVRTTFLGTALHGKRGTAPRPETTG